MTCNLAVALINSWELASLSFPFIIPVSFSKMLLKCPLPTAALLLQQAWAQAANPTSSYYAPGVPTDVPVPGNYTDYLRPRAHFSPPRYFMNGK